MGLTQQQYNELWAEFKRLGESALVMSHYDLASNSAIQDAHLWKLFLLEPEVSDWIQSEFTLLQETELKKMIQGIGGSNSVGKAQLINVLSKLNENKTTKEGPAYIYCYVPLSPEQEHAPNVIKLNKDPFLR
jgi:hypothetical protein